MQCLQIYTKSPLHYSYVFMMSHHAVFALVPIANTGVTKIIAPYIALHILQLGYTC